MLLTRFNPKTVVTVRFADAAVSINADRGVIYFNKAAVALLGLTVPSKVEFVQDETKKLYIVRSAAGFTVEIGRTTTRIQNLPLFNILAPMLPPFPDNRRQTVRVASDPIDAAGEKLYQVMIPPVVPEVIIGDTGFSGHDIKPKNESVAELGNKVEAAFNNFLDKVNNPTPEPSPVKERGKRGPYKTKRSAARLDGPDHSPVKEKQPKDHFKSSEDTPRDLTFGFPHVGTVKADGFVPIKINAKTTLEVRPENVQRTINKYFPK